MNRWTLLIPLAGLVLAAGCRKDDHGHVDLGHAYFPTGIGHWVEYVVDSAWIDEANQITGHRTYHLRELLESELIDDEGRTAQRVERYVLDSLGEWAIRDIWTQTRNSTSAERTEENRRYLKLSFPPHEGEYWNLNVYNAEDPLEVEYQMVDQPWSANGLNFDSTLVVRSTFLNNLVDTLIYIERYAKHVGMVDRQVDSSNTQFIFNDTLPPAPRTRGWYLRQTITAFGP
ncbi:MAG: hypothetical protein H6595_14290 [Flavobacteriales bacterium]|nr:hypothetical protein [Flavobacteriales bacterium]MCB9168636.1 hypothetical protein [Flavobacteriales bacterium]